MSAGGASPRVSVLCDDPRGSRGPRRGLPHGGVSPRSGSPARRPSVGGGPRVLTASPSGLQVSFVFILENLVSLLNLTYKKYLPYTLPRCSSIPIS